METELGIDSFLPRLCTEHCSYLTSSCLLQGGHAAPDRLLQRDLEDGRKMEAGKIGFTHHIAGKRRCYKFEQIGHVAHKLSDSSEGRLTWCLQFMQGIWDRIQRAASKCSIGSAGSELQGGWGWGVDPCSGCLGKQVKMENGQSLAECTEKLCCCRTTDIP